MEMRRALKDKLYELSKSIFTGDAQDLRVLRFPQEYKDMLATVHLLSDMFPNQPPIYHSWETDVNPKLQTPKSKPQTPNSKPQTPNPKTHM